MELYKLRAVRKIIVKLRAFILVKVFRKLKTIESVDAFDVTVKHNIKGLYHCNDRIKLLIDPLMSIEKMDQKSKFLIIGPRNENDLYVLASKGVKMNRITGLDLISYSSRIILGDMHEIPFEENTFDAVIFGWTLSYSSNPAKAMDEVIRVTKPEGLLAIGVEYSNLNKDDSENLLGYSIQDYQKLNKRINSTGQILELAGERAGHVYFDHDAPLKRSHSKSQIVSKVSNVSIVFEVKK